METTLYLSLARTFLRILPGPLDLASWRETFHTHSTLLILFLLYFSLNWGLFRSYSVTGASLLEGRTIFCIHPIIFVLSHLSIRLSCTAAATTMLKLEDQSLKCISCWSCIVQIDHDRVPLQTRRAGLCGGD